MDGLDGLEFRGNELLCDSVRFLSRHFKSFVSSSRLYFEGPVTRNRRDPSSLKN